MAPRSSPPVPPFVDTAWVSNCTKGAEACRLLPLGDLPLQFVWNDDCKKAVGLIKHALRHTPVLARWQPDRQTRVITDASKVDIGTTLEQLHNNDWQPISFWSRKLKPAELNYSATDLEWLAVIMCITRVWHWLLKGRPFTICLDHKALERKLHKSAHDPPITNR